MYMFVKYFHRTELMFMLNPLYNSIENFHHLLTMMELVHWLWLIWLKRVHPHFALVPRNPKKSKNKRIKSTKRKKRFILSGLKVRHLDASRILGQF